MRIMRLTAILAIIFIAIQQNASALKILGIFPFPGRSHLIGGSHLLKELARKGHSVDVVSHFPEKRPIKNWRDISLAGSYPTIANNVTFPMLESFSSIDIREFLETAGSGVCDLLHLPILQDLMKTPKGTYDVIVVEFFLAQCYIAFGAQLQAPVVGFVTSKMQDWLYAPFGNPLNPSYTPGVFAVATQRMNFWERLQNTFLINSLLVQVYLDFRKQIVQVEKYFDRNIWSIEELYNDVALVLVNEHFSSNDIKPLTQDIIDVGGIHVFDNDQQLAHGLQKWLDESTEGCIYFTFGSTVNFESFPKEVVRKFYRSFERIAPVRVVMRGDPQVHGQDVPKNVKMQPWIPQVAVLKHQNVKVFITHGGLLGTQEAIAHKVPMVGIPLFGDQYTNMHNYAKRGIATVLDLLTFNEDALTNAINKVLKDPSYRENISKMSDLFWDRPISALDTAVYWVEYTARHGTVLKSPATELPWWKFHLVDVYGFVLILVSTILWTIKKLSCLLWRKLKSRKVSPAKKNK